MNEAIGLRGRTRADRYAEKIVTGVTVMAIDVVTVDFHSENNVGAVVRAAACFGSQNIHVIGSVPARSDMIRLSGNTQDLVTITQHSNPVDFLSWLRVNDPEHVMISAELSDHSTSLWEHAFDTGKKTYLVIGNETSGVPTELLNASQHKLFVPMPGAGYCLNASATCNVFLAEFTRQAMSHSPCDHLVDL